MYVYPIIVWVAFRHRLHIDIHAQICGVDIFQYSL